MHTQSRGQGQKFLLGYFWPFLGNAPWSRFLPCLSTCPLFLKVVNASKPKHEDGAMLKYKDAAILPPASCPPSWTTAADG